MGPRDAFKFAYSKGLIDSESVWLAMIPERNDSVHSYNEAVSERVYLKVVQEFIGAFERSESAVALFFGY
jgi:nucleotidyltransferase substrate binding protein (TIGR01987 family)